MTLKKTEHYVRQIIEKYRSADPDVLCEKMGIIVLEQELPRSVNGFTVRMNDIPFIVLNRELGYYEKRFTKAHELGHIVIHKGINSLNLSCNTGFCVTKFEREADSFAAWLLLSSEMSELESLECVTAEYISKVAHIPMSVADSTFLDR